MARSTTNIGLFLRVFNALSNAPLPKIGRVLAVELNTMSASGKRVGNSCNEMISAPNSFAKPFARSTVRLATIILRTPWANKCWQVSSIVSPAPTSNTVCSEISVKICLDKPTAAYATETAWLPMLVLVRISLATENVC